MTREQTLVVLSFAAVHDQKLSDLPPAGFLRLQDILASMAFITRLFIIVGIITLPLALADYLFFPNLLQLGFGLSTTRPVLCT